MSLPVFATFILMVIATSCSLVVAWRATQATREQERPVHPRFGALLETPAEGVDAVRGDGTITVGRRGKHEKPHPPWLTAQFPAIPAQPAPPPRLDPASHPYPPVNPARPYAPQPVFGEAPQLDVDPGLARQATP